jgi:hypothetical protein
MDFMGFLGCPESIICAYKGFDYEEYVDNMVVYQICRYMYGILLWYY